MALDFSPRDWLALLAAAVGVIALGVGGRLLDDARRIQRPPDPGSPIRWYRYLNPLALAFDLYRHRELLRQLVRRDIEGRYRGSSLGLVWAIANPLLMLGIYTFVFSVVFQVRWRPEAEPMPGEFAVTLFAGLIAFNVFAECVTRAPTLVPAHVNYVRNVVFPLQILPVSTLGTAIFHALVSVGILVVASVVVFGGLSPHLLLLPVVALPLVALSLGCAWLLASLGVYLRDTAYAVSVLTQMLFFCTPILYRIEAVPEGLRPLLRANPLAEVVEGFRRTLVWREMPDWPAWAGVAVVSLVICILGYAWFMTTKSGFADVV